MLMRRASLETRIAPRGPARGKRIGDPESTLDESACGIAEACDGARRGGKGWCRGAADGVPAGNAGGRRPPISRLDERPITPAGAACGPPGESSRRCHPDSPRWPDHAVRHQVPGERTVACAWTKKSRKRLRIGGEYSIRRS